MSLSPILTAAALDGSVVKVVASAVTEARPAIAPPMSPLQPLAERVAAAGEGWGWALTVRRV